MPCPTCATYRKFIQAMIKEFDTYKSNKTALYYKEQCEKVLAQTGADSTDPVTGHGTDHGNEK